MEEENNTPTEEKVEEVSQPSQPKEQKAIEKKLQNFKMPKFRIPKLKEIPGKLVHMFREYKRVIIVSRKPDIDELSKISKVSGIGILVIGFLGFIIQLIFQLIKGVA